MEPEQNRANLVYFNLIRKSKSLKMWLNLAFLLAALNFAANILPLEAVPSALTRQLQIFHEPPVESVFKQTNKVTEHWITQRLDNFNNQDARTFQMVRN